MLLDLFPPEIIKGIFNSLDILSPKATLFIDLLDGCQLLLTSLYEPAVRTITADMLSLTGMLWYYEVIICFTTTL